MKKVVTLFSTNIEDCDHLASSIAEVFEEAANKVERDKKETEKRYSDNVKQLEAVIAKVIHLSVESISLVHNFSYFLDESYPSTNISKLFNRSSEKSATRVQVEGVARNQFETRFRITSRFVANSRYKNSFYISSNKFQILIFL